MEFRILGPLEATGENGQLALAGGKQKALLALLLLQAGRVVPVSRLVDDLWGDDVPDSAQKMVQIFVSQLRKQLPEGVLRTRPPGYLVDLDGHALDLDRFEELARRARALAAEDRSGEAARLLRSALGLWRGPALAEFDEPFAPAESARLAELELACREDAIGADLALGRQAELVGELEALVARHPHRERLRGQLMLALYRSGRHAEALEAYRSFRRLLADDLGIEPPARLKELERRMLQQDPALDLAPEPMPVAAPPRAPTVATQPPPTEAMLKLATVLLADVAASTDALHPEDVRALMSASFDAIATEIRAEGGTIESVAGDTLMAVFGVPTAREDDAVRAVRAARRILERLGGEGRLEVRIGVNTGEVLADDASVTGDAVNVAARLRHGARPGKIVVGDRTARAAGAQFGFRELKRTGGWVVVDDEREAAAARASGLAAPLVGRAHELDALRTAFERTRADRLPSLVTLVGDAGIGKSRLVAEFVEHVNGDADVVIGRCLPSGQSVALSPLADMLKARAGAFETDSSAAAYEKIARLVRTTVDPDLAPDAARAEAALASTLALQPDDDPLASLDPGDRYRELIAGWRALLGSLARRLPVIAVVEDLHWADPTLLDILDELAETPAGPVLFLCTSRSDLLRARPDWGGGRRSFSSIPLDPLSADESRRLISLLLDVDSVGDRARREILARSEGNPFFLEEILRHLIDEGMLVRDGDRWTARDRIEAVELPDSVQAVILARLDLLSPAERRVARRAAVVGRRFWEGAAAAVSEVDDLDTVLRTLRRREFIVERLSSSVAGEREFVFKHVLIRDVAYESLPRTERGRAHLETATWIERTIGERAGEVAEMLGHHYDAAWSYLGTDELRRKAREHLLAAAANAHRRFAIEEGERFARRAVELSERGPERVEALETLGDLHYLTGDAAWRAYTDALAEIDESDPAYPRLAGKAAVFACRWVGTVQTIPELEEVRPVIESGLRAARPGTVERALLLVDRGYMLVQREGRHDEEAVKAIEAAVAAAEETADANLISAALDLAQAEHMHGGRYGDMYRSALQRLELLPRLTDLREIADAHAMVAWSALHIGRYREVELQATAGAERARGVDAGSYLHCLTWRVAGRFMLGDWDGALADQAEIERVSAFDDRELPPSFSMRAYTQSALCHVLRGDEERADSYVDLLLRYFASRPRLWSQGPTLATPLLAVVLARWGRFEEAVGVLPLRPRSGGAGLTYQALCEVTAARGAWDEAPALTSAAREEAAAGQLLALPLYADRLEGRAAAAAGDGEAAAALLRGSADGFRELEAPWEEAWSRLLLGEVLLPLEREPAERELAAALGVFEQLGSVREAERARAPLAHTAM